MQISRLLADNALVRLFRRDRAGEGLVVSMAGIKLGDRLLVAGLTDSWLLAALGKHVGITGRALGIDTSGPAAEQAQRQAEQSGVLVETLEVSYEALPLEPESFDVALVRARGDLVDEVRLRTVLDALRRVLRDGGRCMVLTEAPIQGLRPLRKRRPSGPSSQRVVQLLTECGYRGPRVLAEREGFAFVEAVHRR